MQIHWGDLGAVFGVSLGITLATVVLFSLGIAAWPGNEGGGGVRARPADRPAATVTAVLCFGVCLAIAAFGIALIIAG
ncbi:hypothetical protein [Streptomyces sp. NPDC086787]|uniref:hypothetical protein n=1 Tax=Streptomyces sp. NPDC086787 TaxID=3365759 RepID=UPI0037FCCF01